MLYNPLQDIDKMILGKVEKKIYFQFKKKKVFNSGVFFLNVSNYISN